MRNILSIDLESWVHARSDGSRRPLPAPRPRDPGEGRRLDDGFVPRALDALLERLARHGHRATFFVVAELCDWYPEIAERIDAGGHEIGYHTHHHVTVESPAVLDAELEASRGFLERTRPIGFRAPFVHATPEVLARLPAHGFRYSSSSYGSAGVGRVAGLDEIPISALPWPGLSGRGGTGRGGAGSEGTASDEPWPRDLGFGRLARSLPFGSGLLLALLGRATGRCIERVNRGGRPAVLFVHPWQVVRRPEIAGWRFKADVLLRNPLFLPYTLDVSDTWDWLLERYEWTSFREHRYAS